VASYNRWERDEVKSLLIIIGLGMILSRVVVESATLKEEGLTDDS
jgi:hypothetical protein